MNGEWPGTPVKKTEAGAWPGTSAAVQEQPQQAQKPSGIGGTLLDMLKSLGTGVTKGLSEFGRLQQEGQQQFLGEPPAPGSLSGRPPEQRISPQQGMPDPAAGAQAMTPSYQSKTLPGRAVGAVSEAVTNPINYAIGPGGLAARGTTAGLSALGAQAAHEMFPKSAVAPVIGGAAGGFASAPIISTARRMATTPSAANIQDPVHRHYMQTMERHGIDPSAGDYLGRSGVRKAEQVGGLFGGGGRYEANKIRAERQLTGASMGLMGELGDQVLPTTRRISGDRIGAMFDRAETMFTLDHDQNFIDRLNGIVRQAANERIGDAELARLGAIVDRFKTNVPNTVWKTVNNRLVMGGDAYKSFTEYKSQLSRAMRSGGDLEYFGSQIRAALEDQMDRSAVTPSQQEGVALLRQARNQWYNRGVVLDSVSDSKESTRYGLIDPDKLVRNARGADAADNTELSQLAEAASHIMTAPKPGSIFASSHETGQGLLRHGAQLGAAGVGAGLGFAVGGVPGMAIGAVAPGLFGRAVNVPSVQRFIKNAPLAAGRGEYGRRTATGALVGDERRQRLYDE
jgi:hypothetical protein